MNNMNSSSELVTLPVQSVQVSGPVLRQCILNSPGLLNDIVVSVEEETWQNWQIQRESLPGGTSGALLETVRRYVNKNPETLQDIFICAGKTAWQDCLQAIFDDNHYTQMFLKVFAVEVNKRPVIQKKIANVIGLEASERTDNKVTAPEPTQVPIKMESPEVTEENKTAPSLNTSLASDAVDDDDDEFIVIDELDDSPVKTIKLEIVDENGKEIDAPLKVEPVLSHFMEILESGERLNVSGESLNQDNPNHNETNEELVSKNINSNGRSCIPNKQGLKITDSKSKSNSTIRSLLDKPVSTVPTPAVVNDSQITKKTHQEYSIKTEPITDDEEDLIGNCENDDGKISDGDESDDVSQEKPSSGLLKELRSIQENSTSDDECSDDESSDEDDESQSGEAECQICGKFYKNTKHLIKHAATHASGRNCLCAVCGEWLEQSSALREHMRKHQLEVTPRRNSGITDIAVGKELHECKLCSKYFNSKKEIDDHCKHYHNKNRYACDECDRTFVTAHGLKRHKDKIHSESRPYLCKPCGKSYESSDEYKIHMEKKHNVQVAVTKPVKTSTVTKSESPSRSSSTQDTSSISESLNQSTEDSPAPDKSGKLIKYFCNDCDKKLIFRSVAGLQKHLELHSSERTLECDVCERKFKTPTALGSHKKSHTNHNEQLKNCHFCDGLFKSITGRKLHERAHHQEELKQCFPCELCDKKFTIESSLNKHHHYCQLAAGKTTYKTDTESGEKKYKCDVCSKVFLKEKNLIKHMAYHKKKTPLVSVKVGLKCGKCKASFPKKDLLEEHMKTCGVSIETKPKVALDEPYQCTICQSTFSDLDKLQEHIKMHKSSASGTGKISSVSNNISSSKKQSQYKCETCNKTFKTWSEKLVHTKTAHKSKYSHQCDICLEKFSQFVQLQTHKLEKHRNHVNSKQESPPVKSENKASSSSKPSGSTPSVKRTSSPDDSSSQKRKKKRILNGCKYCEKAFAEQQELIEHEMTHNGIYKYNCGECGDGYRRRDQFHNHMTAAHNNIILSCNECNQKFLSKAELDIHKQGHAGWYPYRCKLCDKAYKFEHFLTTHMSQYHQQ